MDFNLLSAAQTSGRRACLVVALFEERELSPAAHALDTRSGGRIRAVLERGDIEGKLEQTRLLYDLPNIDADRVLLVGCGKREEFGPSAFRKVHERLPRLLNEAGATDATSFLFEVSVADRDVAWQVRYAIETIEAARYRFDRLKSKPDSPRRPLERIDFVLPEGIDPSAHHADLRRGLATAAGVTLARDLANLPGNLCTPTHLAESAQGLGERFASLDVTVVEEAEMGELGMGALLAVAQGSRQPAKLIVLNYHGAGEAAPVALVGKGVTFDSGGISIKPASSMDEMKFDMGGAAAVFGAVQACAELALPVNVVGIVPATENLPDGQAIKPGDVVTSLSGQTIEILNTDAEGRLILCDALTYAERFQPRAVIDLATLTGACLVALGRQASGLFGNDPDLTQALRTAGEVSQDRVWELPLWEEYQEALDSSVADMANIGGREAGAITAAAFLSRYAKAYPWAHIDIAGTAWTSGKKKGATGRPIPMLLEYLSALDAPQQ